MYVGVCVGVGVYVGVCVGVGVCVWVWACVCGCEGGIWCLALLCTTLFTSLEIKMLKARSRIAKIIKIRFAFQVRRNDGVYRYTNTR